MAAPASADQAQRLLQERERLAPSKRRKRPQSSRNRRGKMPSTRSPCMSWCKPLSRAPRASSTRRITHRRRRLRAPIRKQPPCAVRRRRRLFRRRSRRTATRWKCCDGCMTNCARCRRRFQARLINLISRSSRASIRRPLTNATTPLAAHSRMSSSAANRPRQPFAVIVRALVADGGELRLRRQWAPNCLADLLERAHQRVEVLERQGLRSVRQRMVGIGMHFDHEAVCAHGH